MNPAILHYALVDTQHRRLPAYIVLGEAFLCLPRTGFSISRRKSMRPLCPAPCSLLPTPYSLLPIPYSLSTSDDAISATAFHFPSSSRRYVVT